MADAAKPFAFTQFVPGFDFLRSLAGDAGAASAVPGMPGLSNWVAPTLSVEEIDKRIQELKAVQFWLEQNVHAIKATLQALEVQKMTLSTLRGMNVRMEDLANAFARSTEQATTAASEAVREPAPEAAAESPAPAAEPAPAGGAGVVDPLQWWGALTQQFQEIASNALQDAAQMKVPDLAAAVSGAEPARKTPARKAAAKPAKAPAAKPARKRSA